MSVNTKDPDCSSSEPKVPGWRTAVDSAATAPKLEPIRARAAGPGASGSSCSRWPSSSVATQRAWALEFGYSTSRSPGWVKATTVSATSSRWMRLSSTVFMAAYSR